MRFSRRGLLLLGLITAVAACLRFYKLGEIPPGLSGDTAYKGLAANRILEGERPIFFEEIWGGVEPMYMYLLAGFFQLFGSTPVAIKALSALIGTITVPIFYLLVRELFQSRGTALLAASWLTVSFWHISYSRLGWEIILAPLLAILTTLFLWRGLSTNRWEEFVWAGLFLGASLYTYQAMRFLPIFIISYLAYRTLTDKGFCRAHTVKLTAFLLIAVCVFLPLGGYFVTHSDAFLRRAREVSIFNPEKNPRGPIQSLTSNAVKTMGMYSFQGDRSSRHNLSGRPALDILTSAWFILGLLTSLVNRRNPAYSLLLFWLITMSLPPIISDPWTVPHFSRSIGALPAACLFPAIGVQAACKWVKARWPSRTAHRVFTAAVSVLLLASLAATFRDYFIVWASASDLRTDYFDGQFQDVATTMNVLDDRDGVWIVPISALASPHDEPGHYTVEFLYRGEAPFHFLRLDESAVADELSRLAQGYSKVMLVDYKNYVLEEAYKYIDADPKRLAPFLLGKYGEKVEHYEFDAFDVQVYALPTGSILEIADYLEPQAANFAGQLLLTATDFGVRAAADPEQRTLPSGGEAWVVLRWRSLAEPTTDYSVALYLLDQRERVVGQVDKLLLGNNMRGTSHWTPGQEEIDYYVLPNLPATPPGDYHLQVVVYDPSTMNRLALQDDGGNVLGYEHTVGTVQIIEPASPPAVQPMHTVDDGALAPGLSLLGFDLPRGEVNPGDTVEIALYWKAVRDVALDYVVLMELRDAQGSTLAQEESRPAYGTYPTTLWNKGMVVRDWHDVPVEPDAPAGQYELHVGLIRDGLPVGELALGTVSVSGRARSFEVPPMEHQLGWLLGDGVQLLGYDMEKGARAGGSLRLTLYWQCVAEMTESYTVFTHLLDSDNAIKGQRDRLPGVPEAPTTSWIEGEVVADPYEIAVDSEAPEGEYVVEIGMYDAATMKRLPVYDDLGASQGEKVLLEPVQVDR